MHFICPQNFAEKLKTMPMQNFGVQIRYILGNVKVACKAIYREYPHPPPPHGDLNGTVLRLLSKFILSVGTATKMSET